MVNRAVEGIPWKVFLKYLMPAFLLTQQNAPGADFVLKFALLDYLDWKKTVSLRSRNQIYARNAVRAVEIVRYKRLSCEKWRVVVVYGMLEPVLKIPINPRIAANK
jgi:hypothetical protein